MQVLIADDHHLVRDALKQVMMKLESDIQILECSNLSEALALAEENSPLDLAVLDLKMPGATTSSEFCLQFPETPTVIISGYYQRQDIIDAFRNGVSGFISKNLNSEAMLHVFRLVLAGGKYVPDDLLPDGAAGPEKVETPDQAHLRIGSEKDLTKREGEVLAELCKGLSNKSIAKQLDITEVTVKLHLRKVYQKLGAKNRAHAVTIVHDQGLDIQ